MYLIIDNYDSFTYNIYQALLGEGQEVLIKKNDELTLAELESIDIHAVVISPGPGKPEEAGITLDVIKQYRSKLPILGICLGYQAIIQAYGGKIETAPETVHGKTSAIFHNQKCLFHNMPLPFSAARYHSLKVKLPLPSELIATAFDGENNLMAFQHEKEPVYGLQFHPESFMTEMGETIIRNFIKEVNTYHVHDISQAS